MSTDESAQVTASQDPAGVVRLSVNLAPDVAAVFRELCDATDLSATDGIRAAIVSWRDVHAMAGRGLDKSTATQAAQEWLANYHGSIDATALLMAFAAGFRLAAAGAAGSQDKGE